MSGDIQVITLPLPHRMGSVNCYLIQTSTGQYLIDSGGSNARKELHRELEGAGCLPGSLNLVILTHGDFDHIGTQLTSALLSRPGSPCTVTIRLWPSAAICSSTERNRTSSSEPSSLSSLGLGHQSASPPIFSWKMGTTYLHLTFGQKSSLCLGIPGGPSAF